jgi:hypothetical protein
MNRKGDFMRKLLTAVLAALTLVGAGFMAVPATAAGSHDGYYSRDHRYDDRRDYRYDDRRYGDRHRGYDRRDHRRGSWWARHVRRCERAYRTYNRRTDMYRTRYGQYRRCRL